DCYRDHRPVCSCSSRITINDCKVFVPFTFPVFWIPDEQRLSQSFRAVSNIQAILFCRFPFPLVLSVSIFLAHLLTRCFILRRRFLFSRIFPPTLPTVFQR